MEGTIRPKVIEGMKREALCLPVRTPIIEPGDDIAAIAKEYVKPHLKEGDVVVCSEKAVAISQKQVYHESEIEVGKMALFLSRFVTDSPYGIGLRDPRNMQVAIKKVGIFRILLAAFVAAFTKLVGLSGWFYRIAGLEVQMIDGAVDYRFKQLKDYIVLAPKKPNSTAKKISHEIDAPVAIVDVNDIGGSVVVGKHGCGQFTKEEIEELMRHDNPLGQAQQQTPIGILRKK